VLVESETICSEPRKRKRPENFSQEETKKRQKTTKNKESQIQNIVHQQDTAKSPSPIQWVVVHQESTLPQGIFCDQINNLLNIWQRNGLPRQSWGRKIEEIVRMFSWVVGMDMALDEKTDLVFDRVDKEFPFLWKVLYPDNPPKSPEKIAYLFIAGCMDMAINSYAPRKKMLRNSQEFGDSRNPFLKRGDVFDKFVYHIFMHEIKSDIPFYLDRVYPILCTIARDCRAPDIIQVSDSKKEKIISDIVSVLKCPEDGAKQFMQMKLDMIFEKTGISVVF
jgi:hypothetical protein